MGDETREQLLKELTELRQRVAGLEESGIRRDRAGETPLAPGSLFDTTLQSMADAVHVVDRDLRIVLFNKKFKEWCEELGLKVEAVGQTVFEVFPILPEKVRDEYEQVFRTGQILVTEESTQVGERVYFTETRKIPLVEKDEVTGVITVVRDITERKKADQRVIESEQLLQGILTASPIGIGKIRNRVMVWVNESLCTQSGYTQEELQGRNATLFYETSEEGERVGKLLYEEGRAEGRMKRKDGIVRDVLVQVSPTDSHSYIFTIADITEQKEAARRIRESEEKFRHLFALENDALFLIDQETGAILDVNDATCAMYGYSHEELVRMKSTDVSAEPEETERTLRERQHKIPIRLHKRKDGTTFVAEISASYFTLQGRPVTLGAVRDITDRQRAERELIDSEQRYRSVFDNSLYGIMLTRPDGTILTANRRACEMFGMAEGEIVHAGRAGLIVEDDRLHAALAERARTGQWQAELSARRADGSIFPIEVSSSIFVTADGEELTSMSVQDITERKRVEEKLRESAVHLFEAADLARIVYWECDEDAGEFTFNDAFYDLYGTTAEQEGGYRMSKEEYRKRFVHPGDRDELKKRAERGDSRPAAFAFEQYEHRGIRRDGSIIYLLVRHRVVAHEHGRVIKTIGVNQDITDRRKMEDALRESESRLRAILDNSRDAIAVSKEGFLTFVNPAYVSLFGYESADELIGKPIIDVIAPQSRDFVAEIIKKHAAGGSPPSFYVETALKKDGSSFPAEVAVSSYAVKGERFGVAILRDITERKKAEDELKLLKHSIDVHYDGAYWMDTDNRFVYVNEAAGRALGYKAEELLEKTIYDVNPLATPEEMEEVWGWLRKVGSYVTESVHRRKDGTEFPVEITTTYVRFEGREYACGFARDISEKKSLEAQLRQAQKMEAIGTLAGGVAHDFNNILTVIMGLGNVIQMTVGPDDRIRPYIDQIVLSSERAADLTQSLLAFSRKQRITLEPHKVSTVVAGTAKLLKRLLTEDIKLKVRHTDDYAVAMLDVSQIDQVLMNLATNARDAMPSGGSLFIRTDVATLDETFRKIHGFGRPGSYAHLSVSDSGVGMDEKTMARIFDPFFTTKEVGKGTGLGLASVYGIVKQHGGYITVRSEVLKGTTFDIYLPLVDAVVQQPAAAPRALRGGSETVLVVEDDPGVRNLITGVLSKQGYVTLEAGNGDDAIRVFDEHREKIRLVILDVVMPGKNGREVFDEITRIEPKAKAIFMSGYTGDIVIDKGIQREHVEFLQKPLSMANLLSKVREVLDRPGSPTS